MILSYTRAVKCLRGLEWSSGNGQCPECCGVSEAWHGHPLYLNASTIGHEKDCPLAAALQDVGETPLIKGNFTSNLKFERHITKEGFLEIKQSEHKGDIK